jgi:hypothetical protein
MTENRNFLVLKSLVHTYIRTMKGGKQIVVKEHPDTIHTHAKKHEAFLEAFKHHAAHGQFPDAKMHAGANKQFDKLFGGE